MIQTVLFLDVLLTVIPGQKMSKIMVYAEASDAVGQTVQEKGHFAFLLRKDVQTQGLVLMK